MNPRHYELVKLKGMSLDLLPFFCVLTQYMETAILWGYYVSHKKKIHQNPESSGWGMNFELQCPEVTAIFWVH
jgi:hypothetical protein